MQQLQLDERTATKALGAVFTSVRMAVDAAAFGMVASAFPDAGVWMHEAPVAGGRTGEMLALATPATLRRSLKNLGLDDAKIDELGKLTGEALRDAIPADLLGRITARLPLLNA
jgi:hypothetical protein